MKLSEMFPSAYLKSADIDGEMTLTISAVALQEFDTDDGGKEKKAVLTFANEKRMVLNKTNATIIAGMLGDDTDHWIGKEITLHVQDVQFGSKMTPAIRVKQISAKDAAIQAFWKKALEEMFLSREEARAILQENNGDFVKALASLNPPA